MSENEIITPQALTYESLRLLHQKLPFLGLLNRRYTDEFKQGGAKVGEEVLVRYPNRYVVREGAKLVPQSTEESETSLRLTQQKGVDLSVTSKDLTLHIDKFSERYLDPAMTMLAAALEEEILSSVLSDVVHVVSAGGPVPDWYDGMALLGAWFDVHLIPDDQRCLVMNSFDQSGMIDGLKGYVESRAAVGRQYETGRMTHFQGFDIATSLSMPTRQRRGRVEGGLDVFGLEPNAYPKLGEADPDRFDRVTLGDVGSGQGKQMPRPGEWITFNQVYPVHPETKDAQRLFGLKPFKVVERVGREVRFTPPLIHRGAHQNAAVNKAAGHFSELLRKATADNKYYRWNVAFDREAIAFVTADLPLPRDVDFAHRAHHEGIAMRVVRKYDINEDEFPCRIDVLYGRKLLRPDSVCLLVGDSDA